MSEITTAQALDSLTRRHTECSVNGREDWLVIRELRTGTGYGRDSEQRIDLFAMQYTGQHITVGYELKLSRSDWLRELKKPRKRALAMRFTRQFYFAAPRGVIKLDEVPYDCGLIEFEDGPAGDDGFIGSSCRANAPLRDAHPPTWLFVCALLRRVSEETVNQAGVRDRSTAAALAKALQEARDRSRELYSENSRLQLENRLLRAKTEAGGGEQ